MAADTTDTAQRPLTGSVRSERSSHQQHLLWDTLGMLLLRESMTAEETVSGFRVVSVVSGVSRIEDEERI